MSGFVVAIDGPAGAGKSSVSKAVARRLGFALVDTGALYRCIGYAALQAGVSAEDEASLGELAQQRRRRSLSARRRRSTVSSSATTR